MTTILYPEAAFTDIAYERGLFGPDVEIIRRDVGALADLDNADCARADGLMLFRHFFPAEQMARFPKLKVVVRMGVGYDRIDRAEAARRGITVCNCPDYGTTEVADHAVALAMTLRRGVLLHHEAQRRAASAAWTPIDDPLVRRLSSMVVGIVGLGRIGTAAALRFKAFGCRVVFFDPHLPNGVELALGLSRAATLADLLRQSDILSLHVPLTRETRGMVGTGEIALLPQGAVIVNTARGPVLDLAAVEAGLRNGHLAGAGLDVIPVEPPVEPLPELLRAYRAREPWLEGRLVITPHSAFASPEAYEDIKRKSAETMRAVLIDNRPQNVIPSEAD
ncbi:C-terminal binding protein [Bradyrhizobium canariense]|uniref:C-terminal binding protein n=1 Tax=Bradyrhizobium canariense TaxID=255045 RepID=A0A1H2BIU6_9BRAD|nr:C-terminal binding protein [Bradyrhizobium canariense]SDT58064.1 C-terminal binding protein [Bradyrhizobium canariense]